MKLTEEMTGWLRDYDDDQPFNLAVAQFAREFVIPEEEAYRLMVEYFWTNAPKAKPVKLSTKVYNFFK